jgi:hypothetical protein
MTILMLARRLPPPLFVAERLRHDVYARRAAPPDRFRLRLILLFFQQDPGVDDTIDYCFIACFDY